MINILNYIFGLSLLIVSSYSLNSDGLPTSIRSNSGCVVPTTIASSKGFNVKYYSKHNLLPTWSALFSSTNIYKEYTELTPVSSAHAVQGDINLEYAGYPGYPGTLTTWGMVFDGSSFLAEFTTYFKPTETGFYQFFWEDVDNAIMLFIGEDAFSCCDGTADPSNSGLDYFMWITNQMQNHNIGSDYFYFEADIFRPQFNGN
ncbi:unnamed protein product [[Candida] boidinii]|uniref:Unnamed protein product n=1 Tax=Candida boidinii TaxID=5477 RepID=A0ACB5TU98_CANBO|nr:unnamed protein product [[Candida] boidinii]